jgi:hypothetical protein
MGTFDLNRRKFLGALTLGTAHLMFHNPLYGKTPRFSSVDPLQRVALGKTGIKPTLLGMGTGVSGGNRSSFPDPAGQGQEHRHPSPCLRQGHSDV